MTSIKTENTDKFIEKKKTHVHNKKYVVISQPNQNISLACYYHTLLVIYSTSNETEIIC